MSGDFHVPLLGAVSKQNTAIFAAGLLAGLTTLYLPTLLSPPTATLRSLLFLAYPATTHSLAVLLWWTTRHQPSLSPLSSLRPNSPFRYTYLILLATLCLCQLLFASSIAQSVWAPTLVYIGQLLAHFPLIVHCLLVSAAALHVPHHSSAFYLLVLFALLVCVGCGFPYVGSEYALSRRDAGLAWYVLRLIVEVCYTLMMASSVIDVNGEDGDAGRAAVSGMSSEWFMGAHAVRIALWAALAYVCHQYANGKTRLL